MSTAKSGFNPDFGLKRGFLKNIDEPAANHFIKKIKTAHNKSFKTHHKHLSSFYEDYC